MATKRPIFDLGRNLLEQCANIIDKKKLLNELWLEIHNCVSLAEGNDEDIKDLVINLQGLRLDLEAKRSARTEISIKPPKISKNKGTGVHVKNVETSNVETRSIETSNVETRSESGKRLEGNKEKVVEQNQKKKRLCKGCGELSHHDIQNCPKKVR
ncbi:uncharacterized protein LOC110693307 [Chenopodium quinoa]|uniref:uncharacterized protein LOC110693307 n=1 Tax=Chenopodium quinoa TaxID=63459 RepID=UPI000B799920|nr:uncharacterized protein LOC110693307 [Chenopodium quinoa]